MHEGQAHVADRLAVAVAALQGAVDASIGHPTRPPLSRLQLLRDAAEEALVEARGGEPLPPDPHGLCRSS